MRATAGPTKTCTPVGSRRNPAPVPFVPFVDPLVELLSDDEGRRDEATEVAALATASEVEVVVSPSLASST
jgi:hypothetical protein